jgi:glyoxylase-like metal-dependent hydrolase (beta-lactamase superfamily II)
MMGRVFAENPGFGRSIEGANSGDSSPELVATARDAHGGHMSKAMLLVALAACGASTSRPQSPPKIEQVASPGDGIFANAYLVETADGVVAIDATLRVSDARALQQRIAATGKPLLGVLLTHGHPDHYNGAAILIEGRDIPVVATAAVDAVIRKHDAAKEQQWKPMFGAEWPERRAFPTKLVADGEAVRLGGLVFRPHDVGAAESHADTYWTIDGVPTVAFVGDLVFPGMHSYISDGHTAAWLGVLARLERTLPTGTTLYPGHGTPTDVAAIAAQRRYLETLRAEVKRLGPKLDDAARAALVAAMKRHLPASQLEFLLALGADAVAAEVAAER